MDLIDKIVHVKVAREGKIVSYNGPVLIYNKGNCIDIVDPSKPAVERYIKFYSKYYGIVSITLDDGTVFYSNPEAQRKFASGFFTNRSRELTEPEFRELKEGGEFLGERPLKRASSE